MSTVSNIKISLRCDDLSNWNALNPTLNNGELAIVNDTGRQKFKIGNGTSTFSQLPFFNENEITTAALSVQDIIASSISQGLKAKAVPLGFAAGAFLSANANFSQAFGYNAETKADDIYAFVWNGDDERALLDYYQSHGKGTFSINPISGMQGVFIGENSLCSILSDYAKISVDNEAVQDFKMLHISYDEHAQLVNDENIDSHTIYVLSADGYDDQFGNRIINLGSPVSANDAATKNYVDSEIAKIPQPDLTQFYKKSETSSSAEIANAIKNNVQVSAALDSGTQIASISVDGVATPIYAPASEGIYRYPLITAELSTINGSLCCLIQDHAITTIEVSSASTPLVVKLPPKPADNGARDFILRIEVSSSTAPGVTFAGLDESITFDSDSEDWMAIEPGLNLISFTETK